MLKVCSDAGLAERHIMAEDLPTPDPTRTTFALATDDVLLFSRGGPGSASGLLRRLDGAFKANGVIKHSGKDVNEVLDGTAIGIDLVGGTRLVPRALAVDQMADKAVMDAHGTRVCHN